MRRAFISTVSVSCTVACAMPYTVACDLVHGVVHGVVHHHTVHHVLHRTVHRAMRLRCETQPAERQAVTAFPEIRAFERDAADEFVILACDGIWDVMSSQEAPPSHRSSPPPRIPTPPTRSHSRTSSTR